MSEANQIEASLMEQIKDSLATHARSATFACGGSIPIEQHFYSPPVQVRFGSNGLGSILTLPGSEPSSREFKDLLNGSEPATFARAGEEVLDEDYRKAGKLDRGHFATDFCPYAIGIVDTLTQMLLPQTKQSKHNRSIKAELYKLNVYSAPSGKFKPHVDTPRHESQLGSLVVSLPCDHEGGQLAVRNAGNEIVFDWSKSANTADLEPCIKWAAFYSDCQHEVLQVTSGHRITLTYNLYVTRGLGHLAGAAKVLDATTLPLYKTIQTALEKRNFFLNGHVIAIWLTHAYAHSTKNNNFLPASLKGADMSLYETAIALGLRCQVVPVIPNGGYSYDEDGQVDVYEPGNFGPLVTGQIYEGEGNTWGRPMPTARYTWVNRRKKDMDDAQAAYVAFGNDLGSLDVKYSRAAMLIRIPPFRHRHEAVDESQNLWDGIKRDDGMDYSEDGDSYEYDEDEDENEEEQEQEEDDDDDDSDGAASDGAASDGVANGGVADDVGAKDEDETAFTFTSEAAG